MSKPATPSSSTNELIELATKIANGEIPSEDYRNLLQERIEQSVQNREAFEERARERGEDFVERYGLLIEQILVLMEEYENGLLRHADFFETGNPDDLLSGNDLLVQAISPLLEMLGRYNAAYLEYGPSEFPLLNNITITLELLAEGKGDIRGLEEIRDAALKFYRDLLDEIDEEGADGSSQQKVLGDIITALEELEPVDHPSKIDEAVRPLQLALEAKEVVDKKDFLAEHSTTPTNMPAANVLINISNGVLDGEYTLDRFRETFYWYRDFMANFEEQFLQTKNAKSNSQIVLDELPKMQEVLEHHAEVVLDLEDAMDDFVEETVEPLLEELIEIIERLESSTQVLESAADRGSKLFCVQCGHGNYPFDRICQKCSAKLPQMMNPSMSAQPTLEIEERSGLEGEDVDDFQLGEGEYQLFKTAYHYYERQIDAETFRQEINASRQTLIEAERDTAGATLPELTEEQKATMTPEELQYVEDSENRFYETQKLLEEGIDEWARGLDFFEDYIDSRHRPTMEKGIQAIFSASMKLHKVEKLSELTEDPPEAESEEESDE